MSKASRPVPEGMHSVTPHLVIKGAADAIEFYKKGFGAQEILRVPGPDGRSVLHAELRIGDSTLFLADEFPGECSCRSPESLGGSTATLHLYVPDVDAAFQRAIEAGGTSIMAPTDMFWGDRYGQLMDPFGHHWSIATHQEDLNAEEIAERTHAFFAAMQKSSAA